MRSLRRPLGLVMIALALAAARATEKSGTTRQPLPSESPAPLVTEDAAARTIRQTLPKGVNDLRPSGPATGPSLPAACPSPGTDGDLVYVASGKPEALVDPCGRGAGPAPGWFQVLDLALAREAAIMRALGQSTAADSQPADPFLQAIPKAIPAGNQAKDSTQRALDQLDVAGQTPLPRP